MRNERTAPTPLTIMFWPESAYGPTNQCIGLAAILRDRGHTIVFAAESSWAGKLAPSASSRNSSTWPNRPTDASDEDAGAVLDRVHRRDRAGVPQADHRTAGLVHPAHLPGPHRRR